MTRSSCAVPLLSPHHLQAAVCGAAPHEHRSLLEACAADGAAEDPTAASSAGATQEGGDVIQRQRLFSVYVHAPPSFEGG